MSHGNIVVLLACVAAAISVHGLPTDGPTELVMTNVIFRHGKRTTDRHYPTDPYNGEEYYPIGLGGLTNDGKLQEFRLGQFLRREYGGFLGEDYTDKLVETRSTDTTRTKQSAQLVLAGLFPPSKTQTWNDELPWQPIPVFAKLKKEEDLLHPDCERKLSIFNSLKHRPDVYDSFIKPYEKLFSYVEEHSGMPIKHPQNLIDLYFIVNTEQELNMTLPAWVQAIYPEPMYSTASLTYSYANQDNELKRINAGYLLKKMLNDMKSKIDQVEMHREKKIYLYSGHETTIGYMLYALRVLKPHVPPYSSSILFELHKNPSDEYFVKLRYRQTPSSLVDLAVPGCTTLCPIEQFINLQKSILPTETMQKACSLTEI